MVLIRRSMGKRTLGKLAVEQLGPGLDLGLLGVVDAIEEGATPEGELSVGVVAERMGVDPSRGSRLVARAIEAGYVSRLPAQDDGRRVQLALTAEGGALSEAMHRFRQAHFALRMRGWSARDRREFARLLTRFVA